MRDARKRASRRTDPTIIPLIPPPEPTDLEVGAAGSDVDVQKRIALLTRGVSALLRAIEALPRARSARESA